MAMCVWRLEIEYVSLVVAAALQIADIPIPIPVTFTVAVAVTVIRPDKITRQSTHSTPLLYLRVVYFNTFNSDIHPLHHWNSEVPYSIINSFHQY